MSSSRFDEDHDYAFADQALALRKRAGLTQRDIGALLDVSLHSIHAWEAGRSYPATERLQRLIAVYVERGAFRTGREEEEAAALWATVRAKAARRTPPFDPAWFAGLPRTGDDGRPTAPVTPADAAAAPRQDWGEAPAAPVIQGRAAELSTLARWIGEEHSRVVQVLGAGGIGKTTIAVQLAHDLAPAFTAVYWRSLRNAPPAEEWLAGAIGALSTGQAALPDGLAARLGLLLEALRAQRALLVLDNLEAVLEPGAPEVRYRAGHEGYGTLLQRLAESVHQGCLLLTSREQPLPADDAAVRALRLEGLGADAGRALLERRRLEGDDAAWQALVARYGGNPLALRMVGETIGAVFGGVIAAFLAQETAVFGGIRQLLDEQMRRLSSLEQAVLTVLAVEREPVGFAEMVAGLGRGIPRGASVEAVEALLRRSLLEWGASGTFTIQPVVLEYVTTRLVEDLAREILAGQPALLVSQPVLKATARDYVRRSQERLIAQPLLERLTDCLGSADEVERRLLALLRGWQGHAAGEQDYGPGAVVNLLRLLRGNLRELDLSHLTIRYAYLQGVEAQDTSLDGAHLSEAVLDEAFNYSTAVALSADGASLVAGTSTGEIFLWRVADRTLMLALQAHTGGVWGVVLSPDGQRLASGSGDGTLKLWDLPSGRLLATVHGHAGGIRGVALSPDGNLMAGGSEDGTVKLWEFPSGRLLATLQGHSGGIRNVAWSGDGRLVASASFDGTLKLWEIPSGRLSATLQGHNGGAHGVALSADGQRVASAGQDGTVKLWEAPRGRLLVTLQGHGSGVLDVALSADGRLVASASEDGTLKLWEAPSGQLLATLQGHNGGVRDVALSADGALLASGGLDGTLKLWEAPGGRLRATLHGHTSGVPSVALSADGRLVASASQDGTIRLWEALSGRLLAALQGHSSGVQGVALSAAGTVLTSVGEDGTLNLWEACSGRLQATLQGHTSLVWGVALSGDGQLVASGSYDGTLTVWDARSGRRLATLDGHSSGVLNVALSGDGRFLASAGFDGTVKLWDVHSSWRLRATLRGHSSAVVDVALSADGTLVASGGQDGIVNLWEVPSGRQLATLNGRAGAVWGVALSGDRRLAASGNFDGSVMLWDTVSGQLLATVQGHTSAVKGVALSADGQFLASGSYDGTIKLWRAPSGIHLRTLRGDRRYERMDITGLTGVSEAQRTALVMLGAVEHERIDDAQSAPAGTPPPPRTASAPEPDPVPTLTPITSRASEEPPTNLPPARTSFVGRTADVATLAQILDLTARSGARLLTLSGVAGCGKTRLALAVAAAVRDSYRDGAWLVELAPLPASPSVDTTAVAALRLHEQPGQDVLDTLIGRLQFRHMLLALDNCEHVVAACATLATRLLGACPDLQILATSQLPLGSADETVWRVETLPLPPAVAGAPAAEMLRLVGQSEAVQLFVQRAQAVQPGFGLNAATAPSVAEICRQLDGLPLAIELAAARLHVLPVDELLARLDDRFRLLRRGGRAAADRHQALQATLDWSYGLLDPAEQALLRRLAVFAGGWEVAAAEAVCAGEKVAAHAVLELLDELLERSLVYVQPTGGTPRYGLLETVRQYGMQQLERIGELTAVSDRRLRWCVALAEHASPALQGPDQAVWLARLAREHDNLRAALQWALDQDHGALGLRLAAGLWQFWRSRSHLSEGRRWLAALLALPADDEDTASRAVRASALEGAAWLTEDEHDFAQASALFAQSDALRRALGGDERTSGLLINAAMEARARGDYARATALLEESLAQQRAHGNRESIKRGGLGLSLARLALVLAEQGAHARATALYDECLTLHRALGDREGVGNALLGLGDVARDRGETDRVRAYCEETLALFRELGHTWVGFSLNNLALAAHLTGDLALAAARAEESVALFRGLQAGPSLAEVLVTLARIKGAQEVAGAARAALAEALTLAGVAGPRLVVAAALDELGVLAIRQGEMQWGVTLLGAATRMRQAMGTPVRPVDRSRIGDVLTAAQESLGDRAYDDAWTTGQTLPVEQVVARATAAQEDRPERPAEYAGAE